MIALDSMEDNETPVSELLTQWKHIIASNKKKPMKSQYRDYNRGLKYLRIYKRHPTCALYKRAIFYLLRSGPGTLDMQTYNADYEGEEYVILTTRVKNM